MPDKRPALGRGLSALIPAAAAPLPPAPAREASPGRPAEIDIDLLTPNPRQPRTQMEETALEELAQSIRSHGVIQPILVRRVGDHTEIVAGERRWRAAQRAGLLKVPVIYRANLKDPATFFSAQRFPIQPGDVLYVSNAGAAELQKFLNIVASVFYPAVVIRGITQ